MLQDLKSCDLPRLQIPTVFAKSAYIKHPEIEIEIAHAGQGNWRAFQALGLDLAHILRIAESWESELSSIQRPWLCWNVDEKWCLVQQRLVSSAGWTPLIGFDPRVGPPSVTVPGAVIFDFNRLLGFPVLYPHFPLELVFKFADRLAFWHSDLLVRPEKMRKLASVFDALQSGETAAVYCSPGLRHSFSAKMKRFWELAGCTTRKASRDQFEKGCGWWMEYWAHPNQPDPHRISKRYYWDHGAGIYYWGQRAGGKVRAIPARKYDEGHFTKIGNPKYRRFREGGWSDARRSMNEEINANFDLADACRFLGIEP